jgi:hypothetical protein
MVMMEEAAGAENVTFAALMTCNSPIVCAAGSPEIVGVAVEVPSMTRMSFAAGTVRAGVQLVSVVNTVSVAPVHVYVVCAPANPAANIRLQVAIPSKFLFMK